MVPPNRTDPPVGRKRRQNGESEVHEGPIRKVKRRDNRVDHLERWGYDNMPASKSARTARSQSGSTGPSPT